MATDAPIVEPITDLHPTQGKPTGLITKAWANWNRSVTRSMNGTTVSVGATSTVRIVFADSPYTIAGASINLVCDTDGGAIVVNYPLGENGANVRVGNAGTGNNDVTLNGNGSETIQGSASQTLFDGEILDSIFQSTEFWR